jgi:outer membrane lipoprotein-sorting protein
MKKIAVYVLFTFVLSSVLAVTHASAQGVLSEILRRMDENNKSVNSIQATIQMSKYDAALKQYDPVSVGTTKYLPKQKSTENRRYVRIDWDKPVKEQLVIIEETYRLFRPRLNQVVEGSVQGAKTSAGSGNALAFMNMSREQLRANYETVYLGEEEVKDGPLTWHIQLNPKTAGNYKYAELWVDKDGMPRQIRIVERNEDSTTVLLSSFRKNEKISTAAFKLDTGNAKVIKG